MIVNKNKKSQRQIQASIDVCTSELSQLDTEYRRLNDRRSILTSRISTLTQELQLSHYDADPFDQWSADTALAKKA